MSQLDVTATRYFIAGVQLLKDIEVKDQTGKVIFTVPNMEDPKSIKILSQMVDAFNGLVIGEAKRK